jgi:5-keto-L-gluconate epimerase
VARLPFSLADVLPDPASYGSWEELERDVALVKSSGYDAVELQIADPSLFEEARVVSLLSRAGLPLCAFQTGATYATRGNCLSSPDPRVRQRTISLLRSHVDLAARLEAVIVFGSLQGRRSDEPIAEAGRARIVDALRDVCRYASDKGVVIAMEPVNHLEVGWHTTIAEVESLARGLALPGARMMIDSFHMNIEERSMTAAIPRISDLLAHVHLSETNRDILGAGHWDTAGFLAALAAAGYRGCVSVGVYTSGRPRAESITSCMTALQQALGGR